MKFFRVARHHVYAVSLMALSLVLISFLLLTNPRDIQVTWLVVPVILLFFIAFCFSMLVMFMLRILTKQYRKQRIVGVVSAAFITVVTILASTGGISVPDIIILALILLIVTVYIDKF